MKAGRRPARHGVVPRHPLKWDAAKFIDTVVWTARVTRSSAIDLLNTPYPMYLRLVAGALRSVKAENP